MAQQLKQEMDNGGTPLLNQLKGATAKGNSPEVLFLGAPEPLIPKWPMVVEAIHPLQVYLELKP